MPRSKRICPAGEVFHVLNRAVARLTIFEKPADYDAFLRVLNETWQLVPLPIFAMAVMPNHWHFVVRPNTDEQVSDFFRRLSVMHTMRYHAHYKTAGTAHLYQGRFKSFPIQSDEHLLTVMRYVERNPVRANFVEQAEDWQWGSAYARQQPTDQRLWLATPDDPPLPRQWRSWVNKPQTDAEVKALRACIQRGLPFGDDRWIRSSTVRLSLESTTRPRGRPRKES
ncbi:MAG: transposase [Acidobacteria bacterium]|nr:transposase [Acidobacteriota bacterium]